MGTNYYLEDREPCPECGRAYERRHIGKSSAGWCFSLHVYPDEGINDLPDWEQLWSRPGTRIFDEYGRTKTVEQLRQTITDRRMDSTTNFGTTWFFRNHAEAGPNNLARHRIEPGYCIGHGAGTWDLIVGDFS